MIELRQTVTAGRVNALFIGHDPEFAGVNFSTQYELILSKFSDIKSLAYAEQVHGDQAYEVSAASNRLHFVGEGDAIFSREKDTALLIRTADCVPILFYSETGPLVGAVHAGWRGLERKVLTKTLKAASANVPDLKFVIGPFIGKRSYEVGNDVADRFASASLEPKTEGKFWLNLRAILETELSALGVSQEQVIWHDEDTLAAKDWFSARRGDTRRNLSLVWLSAI